ncbi:MAG: hypothetical protein ACOX1F_00175 [Erysipelotrichaceae bacterium]
MFINLVMNLCTLLNSKKNTKLRFRIIKAAKALRDDVDFWLYQIAAGIRQILSKCDVGVKGLQKIEKRKYIHQLKLILQIKISISNMTGCRLSVFIMEKLLNWCIFSTT